MESKSQLKQEVCLTFFPCTQMFQLLISYCSVENIQTCASLPGMLPTFTVPSTGPQEVAHQTAFNFTPSLFRLLPDTTTSHSTPLSPHRLIQQWKHCLRTAPRLTEASTVRLETLYYKYMYKATLEALPIPLFSAIQGHPCLSFPPLLFSPPPLWLILQFSVSIFIFLPQ